VAKKGSKTRQKLEAEQNRGEDIGEECGIPRGKRAAKGRIWRRVIWRKRGTNNLEGRGPVHRSRK